MRSFIFIFLFICNIFEAFAREPLLADVVDKNINITTSFDGAKIIIYGAIDNKFYKDSTLIINIIGPSTDIKIKKKEKYFGVWLAGNNEMEFLDVPGYYAIASNKEFFENIDNSILNRLQLGWDNLRMNNNYPEDQKKSYKRLLKIFYINRDLFQSNNTIDTLGDTLFRTEFILPAIAPTGIYKVKSFLLKGHSVIGLKRSFSDTNNLSDFLKGELRN